MKNNFFFPLAVILIASFLLAACGGTLSGPNDPPPAEGYYWYIVGAGETFKSISCKCGGCALGSGTALALANGMLEGNTLQAGTRIQVPCDIEAPARATSTAVVATIEAKYASTRAAWTATPTATATPTPQPTLQRVAGDPCEYFVVRDPATTGGIADTLAAIAEMYGYTYPYLAERNGLVAPYILQPGQRLKIRCLP